MSQALNHGLVPELLRGVLQTALDDALPFGWLGRVVGVRPDGVLLFRLARDDFRAGRTDNVTSDTPVTLEEINDGKATDAVLAAVELLRRA